MILAGDIGGTHTRLALFEPAGGRLALVGESSFCSRDHATLEEIVAKFLASRSGMIHRACLGIAGPVRHGIVHTPNLPWTVEAPALARAIGVSAVDLINDLEANARGIDALQPTDLVVINPGLPDSGGPRAVISAGTGLGEAAVFCAGAQHHVLASEGGHADFAPRNQLEIELLRHLAKRYGHVSYERILSGPGLVNVYEFLRDTGRGEESPRMAEALRSGDAAQIISQAALQGACHLCEQALDLWIAIYGAEAGNLALRVLATGGVLLGGGIAPKLVSRLAASGFLDSFTDKGRMRPLLETIPVFVITNENTALLGAAHCAAEMLELATSASS
ncbi:MAG TPA: glucokinase [Terriglobales bacterium]|nr:glucokinase [Terriglobales bacterium]